MKQGDVHISWIDRLFIKVETFACYHSRAVIFFSILLASISICITVYSLKFNTNRSDLIAQHLEYNTLYEAYREEFDDFDGMIIVAEADKPEALAGFAETFASQLHDRSELFSRVFYKIDTSYFKSKALFYLDLLDLEEITVKIKSRREFLESINFSPGLNQLLSSINREIGSGVVDFLLTDFIGEDGAEVRASPHSQKIDPTNLSFLASLLEQMTGHLDDSPVYRSPWQSFLIDNGDSLRGQGYMVSENERMLFILLNPRETGGDFKGSKNAIDTIRKLIADVVAKYPDVDVGLTGGEVIASDEMAVTLSDVSKASQISLAGVTLLFIAVFRSIVKPLMAVFSLLLALCWAMGFTTITVGHLNILSVVFTTILIGLGIDFGIHIIERYREERSRGKVVSEALSATIQNTGRGNFSGAITIAIAFGAMTLTDFLGIAELGWIAGFGIIFCLCAMVFILPALITLEEKWLKKDPHPKGDVKNKPDVIDRFFKHYLLIIFACVASVAFSSLAFFNFEFDYNILNLQVNGIEAVRYEKKIIEQEGRSSWYAAMITDSLEETRRRHKLLESLPLVSKVESIISVLPKRQKEKSIVIQEMAPIVDKWDVESENVRLSLDGLKKTVKRIMFKLRNRDGEKNFVNQINYSARKFLDKMKTLDPADADLKLSNFSKKLFRDYREKTDNLKTAVHAEPVTLEEISGSIKKRFVGKNGKYLIAIYPKVSIWNRESMEKFLAALRKVDSKVTGNAVHTYTSSIMMRDGYIKGGAYAFIAIVIYLGATLRSVRGTIFVLLPVFVGGIWTVGIMELLGARLNLANLVILPLILGIGVVNGIHITHRYREEKDKKICVLSRSTGQAIVLSSLTTMIGFGSLMVANHQGVFSLGLVLTLGVGGCMLASIILLPALLQLCSVKGWKI